MKFEKGKCGNPSGRPRGRLNKITADIRALILGALEEVGGRTYLVTQANANPNAFLALIGKLLPRDIKVEQATRAYIVAPEQAATMAEWVASVQAVPETRKRGIDRDHSHPFCLRKAVADFRKWPPLLESHPKTQSVRTHVRKPPAAARPRIVRRNACRPAQ